MNQDYRTRHLLSGGMCINEATGCKLRVEQDDGERRFVLYDRHGNGTRLPYPVTPAEQPTRWMSCCYEARQHDTTARAKITATHWTSGTVR